MKLFRTNNIETIKSCQTASTILVFNHRTYCGLNGLTIW